jgi:hypothetical protein
MKTLELIPQNQNGTYTAPMRREDALTGGDWERAYTLACHEDGVQYLTAPIPRKTRSRRKTESKV